MEVKKHNIFALKRIFVTSLKKRNKSFFTEHLAGMFQYASDFFHLKAKKERFRSLNQNVMEI